MADDEEVYGEARVRRLKELLRDLAELIRDLDAQGQLLGRVPELIRLMGEARSELFHYEVRSTYDTPEVADSRRIIEEIDRASFRSPEEHEDDEPWRRPKGE
ncbi:MAG: hypothetical protein ABJD11_03210 [Gemmatimonadota bacterium]